MHRRKSELCIGSAVQSPKCQLRLIALILILLSWSGSARADQPIFNEMPRWRGGYGAQLVQVYRVAREREENGDAFSTRYHYSKLEGVYTWERWIRMTSKLRFLGQRTIDERVQSESGPTDLRLAVPLKSYFNLDGRSGSYTLTPEFTLPLTAQDHGQLFVGNRRYGWSAGYETETYYFHFGTSVAVRKQEQHPDLQYVAHLSTGMNGFFIGFAGHLKMDVHYNDMGGGHHIVRVGPTLYGQFSDTWHWQVKWHRATYEKHRHFGVLKDQLFSLGVAFVQ